MRKIVINIDFGGFGLSHEAMLRYAEIKGIKLISVERDNSLIPYDYYTDEIDEDNYFFDNDISRDDPALVQAVEELGGKANGKWSSLKVCEIPEDVNWHIVEYDGLEHVAEEHRTWR
jgi:hypothetical protein